MSRQAKIIIFSLILIFSIYQKQTKEEVVDNDEIVTETIPKKNPKWKKEPAREICEDEITNEQYNSAKIVYPKPKNGHSPYDKYFGKGIYNNSSGNEFFIKNSNSTDAVVLLVNAYTGRKVRNEFVSKGSNFKMTGVPDGTYYLEWFSGTMWSPELKLGTRFKGGFQTNASFTKTKERSDWMSVDGYKKWTVTLYSVVGGDVESEKINSDEFFN
jgi:hypothetical protein